MRTNFFTTDVTQRVARRLGLPWTIQMQDWAIEVADHERLIEFANALHSENATSDRVCLLELVVASLDDWLTANERSSVERYDICAQLRPLLAPTLDQFPDVIEYWLEHEFPVASLLRLILK